MANVPQDLGRYYAQTYYQIPPFEKLKKIARADNYKIEIVKKFIKTGSLLEIGSAFGVFAYQAKTAGFKVDAIEMDQRCCEHLRKVIGVNAVKSDRPDKAVEAMEPHDVIALWHVLEHLPNPWECLAAMARNIKPGGILVIATPNPEAFQFRVMGVRWPHIDAPRHIHLIPNKLLIEYLERFNFQPALLTANDKDARSWNRFGWQRYLMNRFSNKWLQGCSFILGYVIATFMSFFEREKGSAYTIIFRKKER